MANSPHKRIRLKRALEFICLILAFWPIWLWYASRISDASDEPWGLISLATAICFLYEGRSEKRDEDDAHPIGPALVLLYIAVFAFAPNLILSLIVVLSLWFILPGARSMPNRAGICGLLLISLPIIPSLNFYGGYPLRFLTAAGASQMLHLLGLAVSQDGTMLTVQSKMVAIDAPCSGISMLWAAMFVTLLLSAWMKMRWKPTFLLCLLSFGIIMVGNVIRAATLVVYDGMTLRYPLLGLSKLEPRVHIALGLVIFALSTVCIIFSALFLMKKNEETGNGGISKSALLAIHLPQYLTREWIKPARALASFLLIPLCLTASALPFIARPGHSAVLISAPPIWPTEIGGNRLLPVPALVEETAFARDFPGAMKRFTDGKSAYFIRVINKETRQLHPSSDCFRGMGYKIEFRPIVCTRTGERWNSFLASKEGRDYLVMERLYDEHGQSWTDVSAWYWAAALGRSKGPWWAITMATPLPAAVSP
jgi:exosortase/archaeosortase family protein